MNRHLTVKGTPEFSTYRESLDPLSQIAIKINEIIGTLRKGQEVGNNIPKRLIPKQIKKKYKITNLWRVELSKGDRLIYSFVDLEDENIAWIIMAMDHRKYEKIFKY